MQIPTSATSSSFGAWVVVVGSSCHPNIASYICVCFFCCRITSLDPPSQSKYFTAIRSHFCMWVTFFDCRPCLEEEKTDWLMSTQLLWVVHNWVITGTSSFSGEVHFVLAPQFSTWASSCCCLIVMHELTARCKQLTSIANCVFLACCRASNATQSVIESVVKL